jgi:hypothetical protein
MTNNSIGKAIHSYRNCISCSLAVPGRLRTQRSIRLFYATFLASSATGVPNVCRVSLKRRFRTGKRPRAERF